VAGNRQPESLRQGCRQGVFWGVLRFEQRLNFRERCVLRDQQRGRLAHIGVGATHETVDLILEFKVFLVFKLTLDCGQEHG